jgi:hypothetical protein
MRIFVTGATVSAAIGASVGWALPGLAASETPLAVTPGLWEMTSQTETSGAPPVPPDATAGMTPEQKAKFEAAMQAMIAKQTQPHTVKTCVTAERLKRGFTGDDKHKDCQTTVVDSTSKVLDVKIACTGGDQPSTGTIHYEAVDAKTVVGKVDMNIGRGGKSMEVRNDIHGKWLAADCGDVKPGK